jgi:hypothetical protein
VTVLARSPAQLDLAVAHDHVPVGDGDDDLAGPQRQPVGGGDDVEVRAPREDLRQDARSRGGHVRDDQDARRQVGGQRVDDRSQRLQTAGRRADHDDVDRCARGWLRFVH